VAPPGKLHHLATCKEWGTQDWDHKFTRLVNKQLSDLWKIPTPECHSISEPFRPEELAAALKHLKQRKSLGLDSIFHHADDLAIMHADGDWQAVEGVLTKDMATEGEYLQTWKLKLRTAKTLSAAFHLNNKEAKCELKVKYNNEILPFCSEPKYLGVTLDRLLTSHITHTLSHFIRS